MFPRPEQESWCHRQVGIEHGESSASFFFFVRLLLSLREHADSVLDRVDRVSDNRQYYEQHDHDDRYHVVRLHSGLGVVE